MLPINFHKTFIPERRLIAALLEYASLGKAGTLLEMSEDTGIPTGKSSGKMPAILDYCRGMGLVVVTKGQAQKKKPVLTPFGEAAILNDKYLGEPLSQWLAHFNLCRSDIGAKVWHQVFAKGKGSLGIYFTPEQLENYLTAYYGDKKSRTGPLLAMYSDDAALGRSKIVSIEGKKVSRHRAPIISSWATAYSALVLDLVETYFPEQTQVTLTDFARKTNFLDVCHWQDVEINTAFAIIEAKRYITFDRQIRPWIIEKRASSQTVWPKIYDDIA